MYKILVAEDETIERMVLCKTLKKQLGQPCVILEAKNGREAAELLEREQPQLAILDIQMPGISGLDVAWKIWEEKAECMIIFLTAYDNFSYAKEAIAVRAWDYILKPYDEKELIHAVDMALQVHDQLSQHGLFSEYSRHPNQQLEDGSENVRMSYVREQIQDYIEKNYDKKLSMQDVAQAMNYSDAYFCKLFKDCFQVNFSTYLNEYRVEKAKAMLRDSRMDIKDISSACGYTDSNYFARVFKRVTNLTPSEYRCTAGGRG